MKKMEIKNLKVKDYLEHLARHQIKEIISDECMSALANVKAQYGDTETHCAGLEVRLGDPEPYIDYIMEIDEFNITGADRLWYELDYEEYAKGGHLEPCLFYTAYLNSATDKDYLKKLLAGFLGEKRARTLYDPLIRIMAVNPKMYVRSIGTMTSRQELDIMRMVLYFPTWDELFQGLSDIGWKGDIKALKAALEPWKEVWSTEAAVDLGPEGVMSEKIGFEMFSPCWKHPVLMSSFISRLEKAGLCLPSKGDALRRWTNILPDGDPFIHTFVAYFKLNYKDGKITEAKAYLEQSPTPGNYYFPAYERPVLVEMELKNRSHVLDPGTAVHWLNELKANRVRKVRFTGDVLEYQHLSELLKHCKERGINPIIEINSKVPKEKMAALPALDAPSLIVDFDLLKSLHGIDLAKTSAKWYMDSGNAGTLPQVVSESEKLGIKELIITGMTPQKPAAVYPEKQQLIEAAEFINNYKNTKMTLSVDSCFSPLRAIMGGENTKRNPNRGIERGCSAGRDRFCIHADGRLSPCMFIKETEQSDSLAAYWEESETVQKLRSIKENTAESCRGCCYRRHCLTCYCK